jgi:hypothetical protein
MPYIDMTVESLYDWRAVLKNFLLVNLKVQLQYEIANWTSSRIDSIASPVHNLFL